MSTKKERLDREFREWKIDIDRRCQEHLEKTPEPKVCLYDQRYLPPIPANVDKIKLEKIQVQVFESVVRPGSWVVYKNSEKIMTFFGENAKQNATKFADELLQP